MAHPYDIPSLLCKEPCVMIQVMTFYDQYDMRFCCCKCSNMKMGCRWICAHCTNDLCFECCPIENASRDKMCVAGLVDFIRHLLRVISMRECDLVGIPVGALLVHKSYGGKVKSLFYQTHKVKMGFEKVVALPGDDDYLLVHLSTRSAADIFKFYPIVTDSTTNQLLSKSSPSPSSRSINSTSIDLLPAPYLSCGFNSHPLWRDLPVEYFPGVRSFTRSVTPFILGPLFAETSNYMYPRIPVIPSQEGLDETALILNSSSDDVPSCAMQGFDHVSCRIHTLASNSEAAPSLSSDEFKFTFSEVFAGIGGFRLGLTPLGGKCVFVSELDVAAQTTYSLNFDEHIARISTNDSSGKDCCATCGTMELRVGDISSIYTHDIPYSDILTGGFPCQPFSERGDQLGLQDPRGQLYLELVRILKSKQPKAFLFENVVGLLTLTGGKRNKRGEPLSQVVLGNTFVQILDAFSGAGYDVSWHIIDAAYFLPQSRERLYIVGFRKDLGIIDGIQWNIGGGYEHFDRSEGKANDEIVESAAAEDTPQECVVLGPGWHSVVRDILESQYEATADFIPPGHEEANTKTGCDSERNDLSNDSIDYSLILLPRQLEKIRNPAYVIKSNKWGRLNGTPRSREIDLNGKAPTLTSGYRNIHNFATRFIMEEKNGTTRQLPRFLSPRECCRIMGFPESFLIPTHFGSSGHGIVSKQSVDKSNSAGDTGDKLTRSSKMSSEFEANLYAGDNSRANLFYRQIGNAVCPPVIQALGKLIIEKISVAVPAVDTTKSCVK